jgi:hypothetical protein
VSGAIEKLISESEVVAHLYAVAGSVAEMIDAASSELAALREELAAYKLTLLDTESQYEAGLDIIKGLRAENARLGEALLPFSLHAAALMAKHYAAMTEISSVGHSHLVAGACFDARAALSGAPHEAEGARAGIWLTKPAGVSEPGIWLSLDQAREIEWAGWDDTLHVECCPACMTTANLGDDHAPDCWLARAIKQAEEAGQ